MEKALRKPCHVDTSATNPDQLRPEITVSERAVPKLHPQTLEPSSQSVITEHYRTHSQTAFPQVEAVF